LYTAIQESGGPDSGGCLNRHPAHKAASTMRFLLEHKHRISVHFLPGYAPDLNPDEHVRSALKGLFRTDPIDDGESLNEAVERAMEVIQEDEAKVRSFFEHPEVAYVREALKW